MGKDEHIKEAAEKRHEMLKDVDEATAPAATSQNPADYLNEEEVEGLRHRAATAAEVKVQPRAGTLTGEIDIDAMGDVKGDGGDAKDYPDDDPAKKLGVPVYAHGLASTKEGVDEVTQAERTLHGVEPSEATKAEMDMGRKLSDTRVSPTNQKKAAARADDARKK
jgi:hypothetical protein